MNVLRRVKVFLFNGILLVFSGLGMKTIEMFFNVYISNRIGTEAIGVYQLIMSIYLFAITVANSGINLVTSRIISEQEAFGLASGVKQAMKRCLFYSIFTGCISCFFLFLLAPFASSLFLHSKVSEISLQILACSLPFLSMASCINGYFSGLRKVKKTVFYQVLEEFFKISIIVFLLNCFFPPCSIENACISLVLGSTLSEVLSFLVLSFLFLKDKVDFGFYKKFNNGRRKINYTKQILEIGLPISFTSYIRSGLSCLKQVLIPLQLEKSGISCELALSQYGIINGMVFPLIMFPCTFVYSFSSLLIPEFSYMNARHESNKMHFALSKIFKICFLFSILVTGFFFCFSKDLSNFIYPENDVSFYIRILCPLVILMYIDNVVDSILKGLNKQVSVMGINILDLVTTILFIYFLLPSHGVSGYIFALYVSEILNGILSFILLIKETKFRIDFLNLLIKPIICILILNFNFSKFCMINSLVQLIFYGIFFIFLYFILLFLFRALKKDDIKF